MDLTKLKRHYGLNRLLLVGFLLLLFVAGAIPGYLSGKWEWMQPPSVHRLTEIKQIQERGVELSDWETLQGKKLLISGQKWFRQDVRRSQRDAEGVSHDGQSATIVFMVQNGPMDRPQVEWTDINGYWRWKSDSERQLEFTVTAQDIARSHSGAVEGENQFSQNENQNGNRDETRSVTARFFRTWTPSQTYAAIQWYAWPEGGSPNPSDWFWRDLGAQVRGDRVPWVAVSAILPIEPLGDLERSRADAEALGKDIQAALIAHSFRGSE